MPRRTLVITLGALLAANGLAMAPLTTTAGAAAPSGAATAASVKAGPIVWGKCKDRVLKTRKAQCGLLTVPLDHARPAGPTIQIAVSRVLHTSKPFKGAVFTSPGGPGSSGLYLSTLGQYVPKGVGLQYDWYGIDPRGVGASLPALSCDNSYFKPGRRPYEGTSQANIDYWVARSQQYAADCAASPAAFLLPHMRTTDNVADLELLRQAIGQSQITWYGFSYGTQIGQVYATLHPASIKAMILDGVVDANQNFFDTTGDQLRAFGKVYSKFFAWIARFDRLYHLGKSKRAVERSVERVVKRLSRKPVQKIGAPELEDVVLNAGYYNGYWPDIAAVISSAADGDIRPLKKAYRAIYPPGKDADNLFAVFLATTCTDSPWPADVPTWVATAKASAAATAPYLAYGAWWFSLPCRTWPAPADPKIFQVSGTQFTAPVLLTSETYDAATPFSGALATRAIFPTSVLVEGRGGTTHSATLFGISCTDNTIAALLKNGKLPKRKAGNRSDRTCPSLRPPNPAAVDADRSSLAPARGQWGV